MEPLEHLKKVDKKLSKVIDRIGILEYQSYNNCADGFTFLVREIVGQMISAKVKKVLYNRLLELCSNVISPTSILALSVEQLRSIGLSRSKSEYIINLATLTSEGNIDFKSLATLSDEEVTKRLTSIKGIGNWTAKMYLLFFLQREDILPYEDGAFLQSYKWLYNTSKVDKESITKRCKKWKPYTSIGARYLYKALDNGLVNESIKNFLDE
jgi:DNA-3-methyladenine glycosylase II